MATIKVTQGANFDPDNNVSPITDVYQNPASDSFTLSIVNSLSGLAYQIADNTTGQTDGLFTANDRFGPNDGIFADFSDNTGGVGLTGGDRGDVLRGGSAVDTLNGGGGNDILEGGGAGDQFDGGSGSDTISYEHSTTSVEIFLIGQYNGFATGDDGQGDSWVGIENARGGSGNDSIYSDIDTDRNVVEGGQGADQIIGDRSDFLSYQHSANGVTIDLSTGTHTGGDAEGDSLFGFQNLYGSTNADTLTGNGNANLIYGLGGADTISTMGGNDQLAISANPTMVDGGTGTDYLIVQRNADITLTNTNFTNFEQVAVQDGASVDMSGVTGFNGVIKSASTAGGGATIVGTQSADRIYAKFGSDVIDAGGGNDAVYAGTGADTISTMDGNDQVAISANPTMVDGGTGTDYLIVQRNADITLTNTNFTNFEQVAVQDGASVDMSGVTGFNGVIKSASTAGGGATIVGTQSADKIYAKFGSDVIDAGGGNDAVYAGAGADTFMETMANFGRDKFANVDLDHDTFQLSSAFAQDTGADHLHFVAYKGSNTVIYGDAGKSGPTIMLVGVDLMVAEAHRTDAFVIS